MVKVIGQVISSGEGDWSGYGAGDWSDYSNSRGKVKFTCEGGWSGLDLVK